MTEETAKGANLNAARDHSRSARLAFVDADILENLARGERIVVSFRRRRRGAASGRRA